MHVAWWLTCCDGLVDDLEEAVARYRAAEVAIPRAEARAKQIVAEARRRRDHARADLAAAIVRADEQGRRQVDIMAVTGYARETVRRIIRSAG